MAHANIDNIPNMFDLSSSEYQNFSYQFKLKSKKDNREKIIQVIGTSYLVVHDFVFNKFRKSFEIDEIEYKN